MAGVALVLVWRENFACCFRSGDPVRKAVRGGDRAWAGSSGPQRVSQIGNAGEMEEMCQEDGRDCENPVTCMGRLSERASVEGCKQTAPPSAVSARAPGFSAIPKTPQRTPRITGHASTDRYKIRV